jgi:hypothetical protein
VDDVGIDITPEPSEADREAILAAVREVLKREESFVRPSPWRLAGWTGQRVGVIDLDMPAGRRWALSARLPLGGRIFSGLNGRGDAK